MRPFCVEIVTQFNCKAETLIRRVEKLYANYCWIDISLLVRQVLNQIGRILLITRACIIR